MRSRSRTVSVVPPTVIACAPQARMSRNAGSKSSAFQTGKARYSYRSFCAATRLDCGVSAAPPDTLCKAMGIEMDARRVAAGEISRNSSIRLPSTSGLACQETPVTLRPGLASDSTSSCSTG